MKNHVILITLLLLFSDYSRSQDVTSTKDSIISKIIDQIVLFPQEKIYLQVDKPLYVSGAKVWFRAWLVDAVLHKPVTNQYVYVELINPLDSVVNRVKIRQSQGALSGYLPLNESLPEGDYTLCAYTENMLNLGKDFFFKKNIRIGSPLSATEQTEVKFKFDKDDKLTAEVSFEDIKTRKKIKPEGLKMMINDQPLKEEKVKNDTLVYCSFKLQEKSNHRVLYVENKKYGKFIAIPYPTDDYDVSFYPEGGYLLDGVSCAVAFKALNSSGLPEEITGKIVDSVGNEYAQVETTHDGMGLISMVSKEGINYFIICKNEQGKEKRFKLPTAQKGMYSLKVETIQNKLLVSVLQSSDIQQQQPLFLLL
ncbi:MAG TPA: MG2 domain-containing protein, partial [Ignavibacteria bacterium]